jgi:hypothetical protein
LNSIQYERHVLPLRVGMCGRHGVVMLGTCSGTRSALIDFIEDPANKCLELEMASCRDWPCLISHHSTSSLHKFESASCYDIRTGIGTIALMLPGLAVRATKTPSFRIQTVTFPNV